jgi:hypothetical protein
MTESEWLNATERRPMLEFLGGRANDRQLRLFAAACCRRIWNLLADERLQTAVGVAERYADGRAGDEELGQACLAAVRVDEARPGPASAVAWFVHWATLPVRGPSLKEAIRLLLEIPGQFAEREGQADLLRCIFDPWPFHPSPIIDPDWLAWNEGLVRRLAEAAYEERTLPAGTLDPARLAVLADALEEAGCTEAELLGHLRGPGPHVRGCWALDVVLGKG